MHLADTQNAPLHQALASTRQQLAQTRLENQQLKTMLDHIPAMIGFWDTDLINRFANHAYLDWFGISPQHINGCHLQDVISPRLFELNRPYIQAALAGQAQRFERIIFNPLSGAKRCSQTDYIPYVHAGAVAGYFVLVSDISAQKTAEQALLQSEHILRESEARYRTVVMDQTEIICRLRADGRYLFANEAYCRFFGKPLDELIGAIWAPLVHPDDRQRVQAELAELGQDNPVISIENRVVDAAQQVRWMQFSNRGIFSASGELLEIQSVGRDITERKEALLHMQQLNAALNQSQRLLRAMAAQNQLRIESERKHFAREVHDELGQILTALHMDLLFLELKYCAQEPGLRRKVQDMKAMLEQAFQAVRHVAANLRPAALELGLAAALRWLCTEFSRTSGVACHFEAKGLAKPSEATAMVVFRIVQESLTNITRYAQATAVEVGLSVGDAELQVSVQDDGVGFDASAAPRAPGYGLLGMQERALMLGGTLHIHSAPGRGTRITLAVPDRPRHTQVAP
jgi:PAS domain S-box-containing protein